MAVIDDLTPIARCFYCGVKIYKGKEIYDAGGPIESCDDHQMAVRDHLLPASRGGSDRPSNLVNSCKRCNSRKSNRTLEEFRRYLQRQQQEYEAAESLMTVAEQFDLPEGSALQRAAGRLLDRAEDISFYGESTNNA